jgi:apolipoprotein N-acyltransferase
VVSYFFGIPFLENTPVFSDIPAACVVVAGVSAAMTSVELSHPGAGPTSILSMIGTGLAHPNWARYLLNAAVFMTFGPMVERELDIPMFLFMLGLSALAGVVVSGLSWLGLILNFGSLVGASIAFFCCRFPKAIVGLSPIDGMVFRFAAPTVLFFLLLMGFGSNAMDPAKFWQMGGSSFLVGGVTGIIFHLLTGPGRVSRAFLQMERRRRERYLSVRNWKGEGS